MISPALQHEIETTFQVVAKTKDEITFVCPEPGCGDTKGKRSVNIQTGKCFCWRCGKGSKGLGFFTSWASALGYKFSASTAVLHVPLDAVLNHRNPSKTLLPVVEPVKMPDGFVHLFDEPESVYARLIGRMAKKKNLTLQDFEQASAGFTRIDPLWEPFCIFPIFEDGVPVYYQGRLYADDPDAPTTKRFPKKSVLPNGSRFWVYNIDQVRENEADIVIVVESILNVLSLKVKLAELGISNAVPVCVFKHHMSKEQALKICRIKSVKEICLLYDHDAIGHSWSGARALSNKMTVTVAEMPSGEDNKKLDPNDDVDAAWESFENRTVYTINGNLLRNLDNKFGHYKKSTVEVPRSYKK